MNYSKYIYRGFLIFLSCILFYFLFPLSRNTQTLEVRGIAVEIVGKRTEHVDAYLEDLRRIDDYLLPFCKRIVFTENPVGQQAGLGGELADLQTAYGVATAKDATITLSSLRHSSLTLHHEFYHLFDFCYPSGILSESRGFQEVWKEEGKNLSLASTQTSTAKEAFVACMLQRYTNPITFQQKAPAIDAFLQEKIEKVQ